MSSDKALNAILRRFRKFLLIIGYIIYNRETTASDNFSLLNLQKIGKVSHICTMSVSYFFAFMIEKAGSLGFSQ
jgi:hypothetical protein